MAPKFLRFERLFSCVCSDSWAGTDGKSTLTGQSGAATFRQCPQLCKQESPTFSAINLSHHCAVSTTRTTPGRELKRRFAVLDCLQLIYGLYRHVVVEFVFQQKKNGFGSMQESELLTKNPVQKGAEPLLCSVRCTSWKTLRYWTCFCTFCLSTARSQRGRLAGNLTQSSAKQYILFVHS